MAFFEQLGKRLTDAGQNVAQQTKNLADITQLNGAISDKEKRISQLFMSIGQAYYEGHRQDPAAENREAIGEIDALYAEIAQNREKIKQIKGVTKCPSCGADVPLSAAFCNACGAKIGREAPVVQADDGQRRCPVCNTPVSGDDMFCGNCGAKMSE